MNRKLFIPGKSKLSPLSLESAVVSYRLGMFSAAKVMSWYKISMNELRQLNRNYYFQLEKTFAPMKQPNLKSGEKDGRNSRKRIRSWYKACGRK